MWQGGRAQRRTAPHAGGKWRDTPGGGGRERERGLKSRTRDLKKGKRDLKSGKRGLQRVGGVSHTREQARALRI